MKRTALTCCATLICAAAAAFAWSAEGEPSPASGSAAPAENAAPAEKSAPEEKAGDASVSRSTVAHGAISRTAFDWSEWQRLPVFHDGRIKPLDTFADEIVTLVTGRSKWSAYDAATAAERNSANPPSKNVYHAPELLYAWITAPDDWASERIIRCEYRQLRQLLRDAMPDVEIEGAFVSLDQILDWKQSQKEQFPIYRSKDLEQRVQALDEAARNGKAPTTVGKDAADKALNGKVAELFRHMREFLDVRDGRNLCIVPGLDPRTLTKQTNPDDSISAWVPLAALLSPEMERLRRDGDVSITALTASDPHELLLILDRREGPRLKLAVIPQIAQAQKFKDQLLVEVRRVKPAFEEMKSAYARGDAAAFAAGMQTFARTVRGVAVAFEESRPKMSPPEPKSINFKQLDDQIWAAFDPLKLDDRQMSFSAYPPAGSTDVELLYNRQRPFQRAWIFFLVATVIVVLSTMVRSQRTVYMLGLVATLAAIAYSAWGFALRVIIAGRPPVSNMYETVIWVSFVVSVLGCWFALIPLTWPGLRWAWKLCGVPLRVKRNDAGTIQGIVFDAPDPDDQGRILARYETPVRIGVSVLRISLFLFGVWFFTRSDTSFRIITLAPPIFGTAVSISSLGTWLVGILTVVVANWFVSRVALTLIGSLVTLVPEARRDGGRLWEQAYTRRYFLIGALPVACFGMMLAHFVGVSSPDILNPRVGSIAAVLRNNYWLTIHVLTIVSSYGAGALAWGIGNVALLYYLFGRYRPEPLGRSLSAATAAGPGTIVPDAPPSDKPTDESPENDGAFQRLLKGVRALLPGRFRQTLRAGLAEFGTGDEHLTRTRIRPPKEVATLATYCYRSMQVAVLLLAAGTILGGLWADVSWGRFWDWDPKEVWALISLLTYLVVLHGRFAGWVGTFGTNAGSVLCFNAILFSWYGVNFALPMVHGWLNGSGQPTEVGLHAYATGAGGLEYVAGGVVLNLLLLGAAWGRYTAETIDRTDQGD